MAGATIAVVAASAPIAIPITTRPNDTVHPFYETLCKIAPNMESGGSDPIVTQAIANLVGVLRNFHRFGRTPDDVPTLAGVSAPL